MMKIRKVFNWKTHTWFDSSGEPYEWSEGKPMKLRWVIAHTMGQSKIDFIRNIGWKMWGKP